jgi:tyrosine-protein kinase Etk/Wzc
MASAPSGTNFVLTKRNLLVATTELRARLGVAEIGKKTGIIGLSLVGEDPQATADLLNHIAETYVRQNVEQKSAEAENTLQFLDSQLPQLKAKLEQAEQRLTSYRNKAGTIDLSEEARLVLTQQVEVQQKIVELEQKRKEAAERFKGDHPAIRTLDSLNALYEKQAKRQDLAVRGLPEHQQEVVRLMRDVDVATQLYTSLLNNAQQLRVVKAGEIGNVRILDSALPSISPIKPKKKVMVLLGLVVGVLLGIAITAFLQVLKNGISDPLDLERLFGLTVFASSPHSRQQSRIARQIRRKVRGVLPLAHTRPDDVAVESFRSLRTSFHFASSKSASKMVLLVGPRPAVGKSFVSANFAAILAQAGARVLLIDADLRRGSLHDHFSRDRGEGLAEILAGKSEFDDMDVGTSCPGLHLLTMGTPPANPSELLLNGRLEALLRSIEDRYDHIVVDSAPLLAVTDAVILSRSAGVVLMVLRHGMHPEREIAASVGRLSQAEIALAGVVFNDVPPQEGGYEGYGVNYQRPSPQNGKV